MKHLTLILILVFSSILFFACHKEEQEEEELKTTVSDYDGNEYPIIKIGNQYWTQENIRSRHYANGEAINDYMYPNNDANLVEKYGLLYSWDEVMHGEKDSENNPSGVQGICPEGWHVPSHAEWTQLTNYVGKQTVFQCDGNVRNVAKALASTEDWLEFEVTKCAIGNDLSKNNLTGFSIYPAGSGAEDSYKNTALFWTCTEYFNENYPDENGKKAYSRQLHNYGVSVYNRNSFKTCHFSVRCVKD